MSEPPENDPFKEWKEIQDHQHDPGYWTGGRVHPLFRRRRHGNMYGCLLLPAGMFVIASAAGRFRTLDWSSLGDALWLLAGMVMVVAGGRLLRPAPREVEQPGNKEDPDLY
jgi:hypothetical protein